jgi:hypothetical protein
MKIVWETKLGSSKAGLKLNKTYSNMLFHPILKIKVLYHEEFGSKTL